MNPFDNRFDGAPDDVRILGNKLLRRIEPRLLERNIHFLHVGQNVHAEATAFK